MISIKKKICITGSSGFIGSALTKWLHNDYDIIGIDRVEPNKELQGYFKYYFVCDILDDIPNIGKVFAVIHLAANPGVRDSHEKFEQVCRDNILGTQRIIDLCISNWKPNRLLLASSSSVYGDEGKSGRELSESDYSKARPKSPYAMSKVAGEQLITTYKNCGMLDGIKTASMRFFTVYGPNQRNSLAIRLFIDWILREEPIKLYGTGKQVRDFTHIDDICSGIQTLVEMDSLEYDIYNIGSGKTQTMNDIIYKIAKYLNKPVTIEYLPENKYDVDATKADNSRLKGSSMWEPKVDFDKGLKGQIEWQKEMLRNESKLK